jgi:hypothetical protein
LEARVAARAWDSEFIGSFTYATAASAKEIKGVGGVPAVNGVATFNGLYGEPRQFHKGEYDGRTITIFEFHDERDLTLVLAHELGHAFHNECAAGKLPLQTITPMTLAETASTFCETLVTDAAGRLERLEFPAGNTVVTRQE